jgi:hypothetical protein
MEALCICTASGVCLEEQLLLLLLLLVPLTRFHCKCRYRVLPDF